jgi:hypothetical protein
MSKNNFAFEIRKDRSFFVNRIHERKVPMSFLEKYREGPLKMELFSKDFDRLSPLQGILAYELYYENGVFQKIFKKSKKRGKEGIIPRIVEKECFTVIVTNQTMFRLIWGFSPDIFYEKTKEVTGVLGINNGYIVCRCRCYPCKMKMRLGSNKNPMLFRYMRGWIIRRCLTHILKKER